MAYDSSVGLTAARSHHQKKSDKQRLELHVDHLCAVRVSTVKKTKKCVVIVVVVVVVGNGSRVCAFVVV